MKEIEKQSLDQTINTLSMASPFSLEEKQVLFESKDLNLRKEKLEEILNTYILDNFNNKTCNNKIQLDKKVAYLFKSLLPFNNLNIGSDKLFFNLLSRLKKVFIVSIPIPIKLDVYFFLEILSN